MGFLKREQCDNREETNQKLNVCATISNKWWKRSEQAPARLSSQTRKLICAQTTYASMELLRARRGTIQELLSVSVKRNSFLSSITILLDPNHHKAPTNRIRSLFFWSRNWKNPAAHQLRGIHFDVRTVLCMTTQQKYLWKERRFLLSKGQLKEKGLVSRQSQANILNMKCIVYIFWFTPPIKLEKVFFSFVLLLFLCQYTAFASLVPT